jgi:tetratricopeptide (TPR) repeat protein
MSSPEELLALIRAAEQEGDPEAVDAAREAYLEVAPAGAEATEERYRLGLARLFRKQDTDGAIECFKEAAKDKSSPLGHEARVSLALCLVNKNKRQQAIFELRKMLPQGVTPTFHTVQALDFLAMLLRDSGAAEADVIKVDQQRVEHLENLASNTADPMERAHFWLRLAAAHADAGTAADRALARARLGDVIKLGASAGESSLQAARSSLKELGR